MRPIEASRRVLQAIKGLAPGAPVPTARELCRAACRLTEAAARLTRAAEAPDLEITVSRAWLTAAGKLSGLAEHIHALGARLDHAEVMVLPPDHAEAALESRPRVIVAKPIPPAKPTASPSLVSLGFVQRSEPFATTPADAPRRISRGRAPPLASTCLSFHSSSRE